MLNADSFSTLEESLNDLSDKNLFSYCDNNPIMRSDACGDLWLSVFCSLGSVYVGDVIGNVISGKKGAKILIPTSSITDYAAAGVSGLIPGAKVLSVIARATVGAGVRQTGNIINGKFNSKQFVKDVGQDILTDKLCIGVSKVVSKVKIGKAGTQSYTKYKKKLSKTHPKMTQKHTYKHINNRNKALSAAGGAVKFGVSVSSSRW